MSWARQKKAVPTRHNTANLSRQDEVAFRTSLTNGEGETVMQPNSARALRVPSLFVW